MAINIGTVLATLGLDHKQFDQGLQDSKKQLGATAKEGGSLSSSLGQVQVGFTAAAAAAAAFVGIVAKGLQAQSEQVRVVNQLNLALANQGNFTPEVSRALQEQAAALQAVTKFGDEAIIKGQALLATSGLQQAGIERATKATLDFATANGQDLNAAFQLVTKAAVGNVSALSRYGIQVDKNLPQAEKFEAALAQIEQRFGGAAQADVQNFSGRMDQLQNSFGDVLEGIGKFVEEAFHVSDALGLVVPVVDRVATFFKVDLVLALGEAKAQFSILQGVVFGFAADFVRAISPVGEIFNSFRDELLKLPGGEIVAKLLPGFETLASLTEENAQHLDNLSAGAFEAAQAFRDESNEAALNAGHLAEVKNQTAAVTTETAELRKELKRIAGIADQIGITKITNDAADLEKALAELDARGEQISTGGLKRILEIQKTLADQGLDVPPRVQAVKDELDALNASAMGFVPSGQELVEVINENGVAVLVTADAVDETGKILDTFTDSTKFTADELQAMDEETTKTAQAMINAAPPLSEVTKKTDDLGLTLQAAADIMDILGVSTDSLIGKLIGAATVARSSGQDFVKGFGQLEKLAGSGKLLSGAGLQAGLSMGTAAVAGVSSVIQATAGGGIAGALGGAVAGGQFGQQIGSIFGPVGETAGAIIGAGVGAAIGLLRGKPEFKKIAEDIGRDFGVQISDELAKQIEETADKLDLGRFEARLLNLGDIIQEAGGAGAFGFQQTQDAAIDLLNAIELGTVPAKEGLSEVGEVFGELAQEAVKAGELADASLINIIMRARQLGQDVPEIAAFVSQQLEEAAKGVTAVVGTSIQIEGKPDQFLQGGIQVFTPEDAQAQATIFSSVFFSTLEEKGLKAAVDALGPAFDALQQKLQDFGTSVDFGGVQRFFEIAADPQFGPLLEGVQGLSDTLLGLGNAGYLTVDAFNAIQQQGQSAFDQLVNAGLTEQEALQQIAPLLQQQIDAANTYGFELDENTQSLIAQAEANGIAFATDPQQQMVSALTVIAEVLGATDEQLARIGGTSKETAAAVEESFGQATDAATEGIAELAQANVDAAAVTAEGSVIMEESLKLVDAAAIGTAGSIDGIADSAIRAAQAVASIPSTPGGAPGAPPGPGGEGGSVPGYQFGGIVTRPQLAMVGEVPEAIIPLTELPAAAASVSSGDRDGGHKETVLNIPISIGNEVLENKVIRIIEDGTRTKRLRVHSRGVGTFGD